MVNYKIAQREHRILARPVLIAVSERLREYQQLFGRSALEELKELVTLATEEPVPWRIHRVEAWKGVMSSYATLKSRMQPQPTLVE